MTWDEYIRDAPIVPSWEEAARLTGIDRRPRIIPWGCRPPWVSDERWAEWQVWQAEAQRKYPPGRVMHCAGDWAMRSVHTVVDSPGE